jgi:hypothetical protein
MIAKFEARKVEEGHSLAEMVGTELAARDHIAFSPQARQFARECHSSIR